MTFDNILGRHADTPRAAVQQTNHLTMCGHALPATEDDSQGRADR